MNGLRVLAVLVALLLAACGSDSTSSSPDVVDDTSVPTDTGELPEDVAPDAAADDTAAPDVAADDVLVDADEPDAADAEAPDAADAVDTVDTVDVPQGLPTALPFEFSRPAAGEPLTEAEIAEFTRVVTGFWKQSQYFRWVRMRSHGMAPGNAEGYPDFALWWQDYAVIREGDTVRYEHRGRADNLTLRTCKVLNNAIAGYLMFGDEDLKWLVEQYSKGLAALSMAMEFEGEEPVVKYLQARAVFPPDNAYETVGGRKVMVDYEPMRRPDESWNAANVHNPANPYWGDMWFVNQRSKDDVPHMYRSVPMLMRAAEEAPDESVRAAAELALEYLRGFAKDIVDSGYQIRTKFEDGVALVPVKEDGAVKDLASLVLFEGIAPNAECTAKLGSALIGYEETDDNHCLDGDGGLYEAFAAKGHYFNYAIIRYFHISAIANALMRHENDQALALLAGLAERSDRILHDETLPNRDEPVWWSDTAAYLLASAASAGLPLTDEEARLVVEQYTLSAEHYAAYELWDPWADTVADGEYRHVPDRGLAVRPTELGYLLEYCYSPLRNPAGATFVDCDIVRDPSRWGE